MANAAVDTYYDKFGPYDRHPRFLNDLNLSPAEAKIFAILAGFQEQCGLAYIDRRFIQKITKLALTTISTAVTRLAKRNLLRRTNKFVHGSYPLVEVFFRPKSGVSDQEQQNISVETEELANKNPIEEQTKNIKDQPRDGFTNIGELNPTTDGEVAPKPSKRAPSAAGASLQEQQMLLKHLKHYDIGGNQAKRLIARYPFERISRQIQHLKYLMETGASINNPAGWLVNAINRNFKPPVAEANLPPTALAGGADIVHRKASTLQSQAEALERQDKLEEALRLARKSDELNPLVENRAMISRVEALLAERAIGAQALRETPPEIFEAILLEEEEKQRLRFRRLGIDAIGTFGKQAAFQAALRRLIDDMPS